MKFKLAGDSNRNNTFNGIASKEEIERRESMGYSHFVCDKTSHFLYMNDEYEQSRLQERLGLEHYKWFQETTGEKHWVLYNPLHYKIDKNWEGRNILKFNDRDYDGQKLETPVNASSLCGMFSWTKIPKNIVFSRKFDLTDIKDLSLMFAGSIIPANFRFDSTINTKNVTNMRYMFYKANMAVPLVLGDYFNTEKVTNMEYMFAETKLVDKTTLGNSFITKNVRNMNRMFFNSHFEGQFDFGENFIVPLEAEAKLMFRGAVVRYTKVPIEYDRDYVSVRKMINNER